MLTASGMVNRSRAPQSALAVDAFESLDFDSEDFESDEPESELLGLR